MASGPLERTLALIEDIEFMMQNGAGWDEVVRRTGHNARALERLLARQGYQALITQAKTRDRMGVHA